MKFSVYLLSLLFVAACANSSDSASETKLEAVAQRAAMTIDTAGVQVPVFENFEQLQALFAAENEETVYVINFWATWCKPCLEEMPYFEELYKDYVDKQVEIVMISLDFKNQLYSNLVPFLQKRQLQPTVFAFTDSNYNNWIGHVHADWDGAIPATIIYKGERQQLVAEAFDNYSELQTLVIDFLQK